MLSIQDLQRFATTLSAAQFEQQLGPFVLVQAPPDTQRQKKARDLGVRGTVRLNDAPSPDRVVSLLMNIEQLMVATLPEVGDDGILVGRLPDCDLVIEDESVSKHHARLSWKAGMRAAVVEDLDSLNGITHNGTKVQGQVSLFNGDEICFGAVRFSYLMTATLHGHLTMWKLKR